MSSVTAARARAACPLSSALPACAPTASSSRRSRAPKASTRSTASSPTRRVSPRSATAIAAGRPRLVSPMRRSARLLGEVDRRGVRELLEQRALGRRRIARERAPGALAAVDLRAQHSPVGGVHDERRAGRADEQPRVLEQHARRRLGAGGGVHVAHDREQRLHLGALPRLPHVRAVGQHDRPRRQQQHEQDEERQAGQVEHVQRARSEQPGAPRRARSPRGR